VISDLGRAQSAFAWLTVSSSSLIRILSFSHTSFFMRMGSTMWSEYLRMIVRRREPDKSSSSPSRRCSVTSVPRAGRSAGSIVYSPVPPDSQRTPWSGGKPARRVMSVTLSAMMNDE
jgi:hypothetical protein